MSKMDNLRAMREAKYAKSRAAAPAATTKPKPAASAAAPAAEKPRAARPPADVEAEPVGERLCGHKNMGGRTCTREHGHEAKSHRYS